MHIYPQMRLSYTWTARPSYWLWHQTGLRLSWFCREVFNILSGRATVVLLWFQDKFWEECCWVAYNNISVYIWTLKLGSKIQYAAAASTIVYILYVHIIEIGTYKSACIKLYNTKSIFTYWTICTLHTLHIYSEEVKRVEGEYTK